MSQASPNASGSTTAEHDYLVLLELALESIVFGDPAPVARRREQLQSLVARLVRSGASARDVVELHVSVMRLVTTQSNPHRAQALQSEGRLQVLELMGSVADAYRTASAERRSADPGQRHRRALELNDTVLQDLVAAQSHLGLEDAQAAADALTNALASARRFLTDLLGDAPVQPGALTRPDPVAPWFEFPQPPAAADARVSVVIADDDPTIRGLLRVILEGSQKFRVVGEAGDGAACVSIAGDLQPDIVLLDLSMPGADGLLALPLLRAVTPHSRLVVVSAFSADRMATPSQAQGADAYLEKADLARELLPALAAALVGRRVGL